MPKVIAFVLAVALTLVIAWLGGDWVVGHFFFLDRF